MYCCVVHKYKLIVLFTPRVMSSKLKKWVWVNLLGNAEIALNDSHLHVPNNPHVLDALRKHPDYFSFLIVRDPLQRFRSTLDHPIIEKWKFPRNDKLVDCLIAKVAAEISSPHKMNEHIQPQWVSCVRPAPGQLTEVLTHIKTIYAMEDPELISKLNSQLKTRHIPLLTPSVDRPHTLKSTYVFSDSQMSQLMSLYKHDVVLWKATVPLDEC